MSGGVHRTLTIVGGVVLLVGAGWSALVLSPRSGNTSTSSQFSSFSLLRNDDIGRRRNLEAVADFADPKTVSPRVPGVELPPPALTADDQQQQLPMEEEDSSSASALAVPEEQFAIAAAAAAEAAAVSDPIVANNIAEGGGFDNNSNNLPPPRVEPNAHLSFESLLEEYVLDDERSNYLINVGAQDGKTHDPTYDLLVSGYEGILFEGFERMKPYLYQNIASIPHPERVYISWGYVSPDTILEQLDYGHARRDADVLKVDIDSFDAHLMTTILGEGGYQPKVVMVEFNPDVPPPLAWHQMYSSHPHNVKKGRLGNYGATASAWYEIMTEKFGYGLVGMELTNENDKCLRCEHNMWFVSAEFLNRRGYRTLDHSEMVGLFWGTHYQNKMKCIHAQKPCLLFPPKELLGAMPNNVQKELKQLDDMERNVRLSMMIAEEDVPCEVWRAYESSVVQGYLAQMEAGCKCENLGKKCVEGDPCLYEWNVRTKQSNIC